VLSVELANHSGAKTALEMQWVLEGKPGTTNVWD
jgi:hypothetical protein